MSPLVRRIPRRSYLPRWGRLRANSNAILIIQLAAATVNLWIQPQPKETSGGDFVPMADHASYIVRTLDEMKVGIIRRG